MAGRGSKKSDEAAVKLVLPSLAGARETVAGRVPERSGHLINGVWEESREVSENINPATGERLGLVGNAGAEEIDAAVKAARKAHAKWAGLDGIERGKYLFRMARLVQERSRELAVTETVDGGKPIRESRDVDVVAAGNHLFSYAGWADKLAYVPGRGESLGVCAQVIPWNFPLLMAAWKVAPALATGNTVVLKPAETTPLTALALGEIALEAGLPKGVLNIVTGGRLTGAGLVAHNDIDKIAFTGSTAVGRSIAAEAAAGRKRLTLELGGKGANIVFADSPLDDAVEGIISGIFFNQGHVCCAGSRLLVQESIADELLSLLRERMLRIRVGDPLDKNTDLGAINSAEQLGRIEGFVAEARLAGSDVWQSCETSGPGNFFAPTLVTGVESSDRIVREEVFGPVLVVQTFRTPGEAVALANDSVYGLAAGVWSGDVSRAIGVAEQLVAGVVWVNTYNIFDPTVPFGGMKASGWGREGGRSGLEGYLK